MDCLFVVGRPQASPEAHRALAVALSGKHPATMEMAPIVDHILMRDGGGTPISRMSFVDPFLESIRRAITDAEVVQAVGRARGVNRTAANPVQVFVFSDVVLPFAVDHLTTWREITPDVVEKMLALGAALLSPSDAYRVYPDLFCSEGAAKKALQRATATRGQNPMITSYMDLSPSAFLIRYQARGARQKTREALCLLDRVGWLREELERHHGPLARFEVTESPAQADHENDLEPLATERSETLGIVDLTEAMRDWRHGASEQAPERVISMDDTILEWLKVRLASLSCRRFQIKTHPQKAA